MTQRQFPSRTAQDEASCPKPSSASSSRWRIQFARSLDALRKGQPLGYLVPPYNFQTAAQAMLVLVERLV